MKFFKILISVVLFQFGLVEVHAQNGLNIELAFNIGLEKRTLNELESIRNGLADRNLRKGKATGEDLSKLGPTGLYQFEIRLNPFKNKNIWLTGGYFSGNKSIDESVIVQNENFGVGTFEVRHHFNEELSWQGIRLGAAQQ